MYFVFVIFFSLTACSWCSVCPDFPVFENKLAPVVHNELKREKFYSDDCFYMIRYDLRDIFAEFCPWIRQGQCSFCQPDFSPCGRCIYNSKEMAAFKIDDGEFVKLYNYSSIWNLTGHFDKITLQCDNCILQDKRGKEHVGSIRSVWTKPQLNLIATSISDLDYLSTKFTTSKVDLANATNVDSKSIQVQCEGDENYRIVCLSAKNSGLLQTVVRIAVEQFFTSDYGKEYMSQHDMFIAKLQGGVERKITCDWPEMEDVIPISEKL